MWNVAINDKLTCNIKVRKRLSNENMFRDIWGEFIDFVLTKGKGCVPSQESMYFWKVKGDP